MNLSVPASLHSLYQGSIVVLMYTVVQYRAVQYRAVQYRVVQYLTSSW